MTFAARLLGRRARLRFLHLILGGALLMPYVVLMTLIFETGVSLMRDVLNPDPLVYLAALPLVAATGFVPLVRTVEVPLARLMLGGPALTVDPAGRGSRGRTALFWFLHLALGGAVGALTLALGAGGAYLLVAPLITGDPPPIADLGWFAPAIGLALLAGPVLASAAVAALLAHLAPRLLGPAPADQIAALRRTAEQLADRNRLARDLHDSVGHTLSVILLQSSAAARVLDSDPEFTRRALTHIEDAAREAQADLDHALGLLRETPRLDHLVDRARKAGLDVAAEIDGDEARIPADTAHDLQQIAREALTNVIRHGGRGPVTVSLRVRDDAAELTVVNPMPDRPDPQPRTGGGRGLLGVRERIEAGNGRMSAGEQAQSWRLWVSMPLGGRT